MTDHIHIDKASADDCFSLAVMVGELLDEIMSATDTRAFNFDLEETTGRLKGFIEQGRYFVLVARDIGGIDLGFVALYECYALYAEGAFGTIPELYVRPGHRANKLGLHLVDRAKSFGVSRGWTRLEVTTPPLPQFERTLAFYEREGFSISGGRKLKLSL